MIDWQLIIVTTHIAEGIVKSRLALLALTA